MNSDNAIILGVVLLVICFGGEPDLMDAIIGRLLP